MKKLIIFASMFLAALSAQTTPATMEPTIHPAGPASKADHRETGYIELSGSTSGGVGLTVRDSSGTEVLYVLPSEPFPGQFLKDFMGFLIGAGIGIIILGLMAIFDWLCRRSTP